MISIGIQIQLLHLKKKMEVILHLLTIIEQLTVKILDLKINHYLLAGIFKYQNNYLNKFN